MELVGYLETLRGECLLIDRKKKKRKKERNQKMKKKSQAKQINAMGWDGAAKGNPDIREVSPPPVAFPDGNEPKKKKSPEKKSVEKKSVEKKSAEKPKRVGVISSIIEFLLVKPMTKADLLDKLIERFPDRNAKSMSGTVAVQLSQSRFKKDHPGFQLNIADGKYSVDQVK